jgi:DNA-binding SARP family transcriptional activator/tetratricopeptide (TPR) repeat protein
MLSGVPDPAVLSVRLLGGLAFAPPGDDLVTVDSPRARSLLGYLILHRDAPQPRQQLAFLLWPDSTEAQARTNLRHLLHTIRQSLPAMFAHLEVKTAAVRWRPTVPYRLDVAEFDEALRLADQAPPDEALARRRAAIASYRGALLDGCYDDWVLAERDRLAHRYVTTLHLVATELAAREDYTEASRVGRELLRADPLREDTYRFLMDVSNRTGDRAGAVRLFHECVSVLQAELGVEPSAATTAAFAGVMRADHSKAPAPAPERFSGPALVGRDAELDRLTGCWAEAERGRRQLVVVTGEPGIGKTRLVEELAARCARHGATVATARSYPTEGELGYGAAIAWLRSGGFVAGMHGDEASAALGPLLPELGGAPAAPAVDPLSEAAQRQRVFDSVSRVFAAHGRPILLVADDAHWCDEQSLQLLHYLVRLPGDVPFLAVATARPAEMPEANWLGTVVDGLQTLDRVTEISLDRLSRSATGELIAALAEHQVAPPVEQVYEDSEGNPLFIVEMMRALAAGADGGLLTPKLQAVIALRLRQLSDPARELLELAATVGREVSAGILVGASALDETSLVRALDELWRRGILRERGTDAYDFTHGKIRDVAYETMSPATRRRNHHLVAETIREVHAADIDVVSGELAHHFDRAGEIGPAVTWYQRAAVQAQLLQATGESVRLLARARDLIRTSRDAEGRARQLAVLAAMCTPLSVLEGCASAQLVDVQRQAVELTHDLGREPDPSLLRSIVMTKLCRRDFAGAITAAAELSDAAARTGDAVLAVESDYLLGISAFWSGEMAMARARFEVAVERFRPARRPEHVERFGHDPQIVCLSRLANVLWFMGRPEDARATRERAIALATEVDDPFSLGVALVFAALLAVDLDEPDRFRQYVRAMGATDQHTIAFATAREAFTGYVEVLDGAAEGLARITSVIDPTAPDYAPGQAATHLRLLAAGYEARPNVAGGVGALDVALGLDGTRIWEPELRRVRAALLAADGEPPAAVEAELGRARSIAEGGALPGHLARIDRSRLTLLG